jgi:hypothetical protein
VNDDYLWDRSGPPDEHVAALERLLAPLGYDERPGSRLPRIAPRSRRVRLPFVMFPLAAAATLVLAVMPLRIERHALPVAASWSVVELEGTASIGTRRVDGQSTLSPGQSLRTGERGRVTLELGEVGRVGVGPATEITLVRAAGGRHRFRLSQGALSAFIWADPGRFFVEARSALAIDLGCAYTLNVDARGEGVLRVTTGWVGFEWRDRQSLIPAEAMCRTRAGVGPGTPYFEDAPATLRDALETIDFGRDDAASRTAAIDAAIASCRPRDALTLWHLLQRVDGAARDRVYDRLAEIVPPPSGVTRAGVRAGNRQMLERWWDDLGYGDTQWWHLMSRPWTDPTATR